MEKDREGRWHFMTPCWQPHLMRVTEKTVVEEETQASEKNSTSVQKLRCRGRAVQKTGSMQPRSSFEQQRARTFKKKKKVLRWGSRPLRKMDRGD